MATLALAPNPWWTGFSDLGVIVPGGKLFTYAAGTSNKLATYTDVFGTVANTNPIILDAAGRVPSGLFLLPVSYKFVLAPATDTDPPSSPIRSQDNIAAPSGVSVNLEVGGVAGEAMLSGQVAYFSKGLGGKVAGRWYLTSGLNAYSSSEAEIIAMVPAAVLSGATGAFRISGVSPSIDTLVAGTRYYVSDLSGRVDATPGTNTRVVGVAETTSSILITTSLGGTTTNIPGNTTVGGTLTVVGAITGNVTGNVTGGTISGTTGTFSGAVTGGTYNGQTISSAANLTGTLAVASTINGQTIGASASFTGTLNVASALQAGTSGGANTLSGSTTMLTTADATPTTVFATHATYTGTALLIAANRAANSAFNLLDAKANNVSQFSVRGDGLVTIAGAATVGGTLTLTTGLIRAPAATSVSLQPAAGGFSGLNISGTTGLTTLSDGLSVTGTITLSSFISGTEQATPAAPAANGYRLFAKDSGGGKTQLAVIFATGAVQIIATEP